MTLAARWRECGTPARVRDAYIARNVTVEALSCNANQPYFTRISAGRHHHAGCRRDCQCGQYFAAGRRWSRWGDPSRGAGPQLLAECRTLGGCETGEAKITGGYRLKARHVIHTVGPIYRGSPRDAELLTSAVRNSLRLADEYHLRSIAFPAISTGVYGYPMDQAACVLLLTIRDYCQSATQIERVIMCLFDQRALRVFNEVLDQLAQ